MDSVTGGIVERNEKRNKMVKRPTLFITFGLYLTSDLRNVVIRYSFLL